VNGQQIDVGSKAYNESVSSDVKGRVASEQSKVNSPPVSSEEGEGEARPYSSNTPPPSATPGFVRMATEAQYTPAVQNSSPGINAAGMPLYAPEARQPNASETTPHNDSAFAQQSQPTQAATIAPATRTEAAVINPVKEKLEEKKIQMNSPQSVFGSFGSTGEYIAASLVGGAVLVGAHVVNTGEKLFTQPVSVTASKANAVVTAVGQNPGGFAAGIASNTVSSFEDNPFKFVGETAGVYGLQKGTEAVLQTGRNIVIASKADYVPPEQVFSGEVLSGAQKFPEQSPTVAQDIARFEATKNAEGNLIGTHVTGSSPSFAAKNLQVKAGPAGAVLKEDPGLYITPAGEGSAYFTGLMENEAYEVKFSLNPIDVKRPGVVQVTYKEIERLPKSVINTPGYSAAASFEKASVGSGKSFITKRAEVSTSEIEAVVPEGAQLTRTTASSFEKYTSLNGVNVPIREFEYAATKQGAKGAFESGGVKFKDVSSSSYTAAKTVTPYPFIRVPEGSSARIVSKGYDLSSSKSSSPLSSSSSVSGSSYAPSSSSGIGNSGSSSSGSSSSYVSSSSGGDSSSGRGSSYTPPPPTYPSSGGSSTNGPPYPPYGPPTYRGPQNRPPDYPPNTGSSTAITESVGDEAYDVFIRRRGKFQMIGARLPFQQAKAQSIVGLQGTAAASAKIVFTGQTSKGRGIVPNDLSREFTTGKKEADVIVQKNRFRISSPGEKTEITMKGIQANRMRKGKQKWW
jgi:hypothetical protein